MNSIGLGATGATGATCATCATGVTGATGAMVYQDVPRLFQFWAATTFPSFDHLRPFASAEKHDLKTKWYNVPSQSCGICGSGNPPQNIPKLAESPCRRCWTVVEQLWGPPDFHADRCRSGADHSSFTFSLSGRAADGFDLRLGCTCGGDWEAVGM